MPIQIGSFPGMLGHRTFRVVLVRPGRGIGLDPSPAASREVSYTGERLEVRLPQG